eukprot:363384-Chlamydomonas_euryale.AAC.3
MENPDRFDMYSVGVTLLQMAFAPLRSDNGLIAFRRRLESTYKWDLREWRRKEGCKLKEYADGLEMLDLDDGAGWDLLCQCMAFKPSNRPSARDAIGHPFLTVPESTLVGMAADETMRRSTWGGDEGGMAARLPAAWPCCNGCVRRCAAGCMRRGAAGCMRHGAAGCMRHGAAGCMRRVAMAACSVLQWLHAAWCTCCMRRGALAACGVLQLATHTKESEVVSAYAAGKGFLMARSNHPKHQASNSLNLSVASRASLLLLLLHAMARERGSWSATDGLSPPLLPKCMQVGAMGSAVGAATRSMEGALSAPKQMIDNAIMTNSKDGELTEATLFEQLGLEEAAPRARDQRTTIAWWQERQAAANRRLGKDGRPASSSSSSNSSGTGVVSADSSGKSNGKVNQKINGKSNEKMNAKMNGKSNGKASGVNKKAGADADEEQTSRPKLPGFFFNRRKNVTVENEKVDTEPEKVSAAAPFSFFNRKK